MTDAHVRRVLDDIHAALLAPDYEANRIAHAQRLVRDALADLVAPATVEWGPQSAAYAERLGQHVIVEAQALGWTWTPDGEGPWPFLLRRIRATNAD